MKNIIAHVQSWNRKRLAKYRARKAIIRPDQRQFLAVMCIIKNESLNINEWIDHYLWQGADHLFIIDNGSTDDTVEKVKLSAKHHDNITLVLRPQRYKQTAHYKFVFRKLMLRKRFQWLLVSDADEFWYCQSGQLLVEGIKKLDYFDLIYCNWSIFGATKAEGHPSSLREALLHRAPQLGPHEFSKWVAKTDALKSGQSIGVHRVGDIDSSRTITEHANLAVNHYITQSKEFWFGVKMKRGDVFDPKNDLVRSKESFEETNKACTHEDTNLASQVRSWKRG
jgi:glycosyltransferase involved in cell wall biosynthesis